MDTTTTPVDRSDPAFSVSTADILDLCDSSTLAPAIDMPALLVRCLGNEAFAFRMLDEFQSSITRLLADIARQTGLHTADADASAIRDLSHSLKGTAATLAADGLRQAAADLEAAAADDDWELIANRVERVRREAQHCLEEISRRRLAKESEFSAAQARRS